MMIVRCFEGMTYALMGRMGSDGWVVGMERVCLMIGNNQHYYGGFCGSKRHVYVYRLLLPDTAGFGNLYRSDRKKNLKGFRSQPIISRDYTS